jgi:hypothetical protein
MNLPRYTRECKNVEELRVLEAPIGAQTPPETVDGSSNHTVAKRRVSDTTSNRIPSNGGFMRLGRIEFFKRRDRRCVSFLPTNRTAWHGFLELCRSLVRDLGVAKTDTAQVLESRQCHQARVGDFRPVKRER